MANENETFEQVCSEMKEVTGRKRFIDSHYCKHCGEQIDGEGSALAEYSDRALAAYKREVESLKWKVDNYAQIVAAKDMEVENLHALIQELADALDGSWNGGVCECCTTLSCPGVKKCPDTKNTVALVVKARELLNAS